MGTKPTKQGDVMTRDEAIKSSYWQDNATNKDLINKIYDEHEAKLKRAYEILEGANLAERDRHLAECKAKDERIAELEAKLDSIAQFLEGA